MNIFQVSGIKPPLEIVNLFREIPGVNYEFVNDHISNCEKIIKENPVDDFTIDTFKEIKDIYKKVTFVLYYLYVNGGIYCETTVIPTNHISTIDLEQKGFVCVKSMMFSDRLFLGFLGSRKKNPIILQILKRIIEASKKEEIESADLVMYKAVDELAKKCFHVMMYTEKHIEGDCVSTLDENDTAIVNNYFDNNKFYKYPVIKKEIKCLKDIKIGVTLIVFDNPTSFFSNGINQNTLYVCEMLLNCGFDVYFIIEDHKLLTVTDEALKQELYDERFKYVKFSDMLYEKFDIIMTVSFSYLDKYILNYKKYNGTKHIGYFCGNSYTMDSEKMLYSDKPGKQNGTYNYLLDGQPKYDEIWCIPQHVEMCLQYWEIMYRCKCIAVPFVWSSNAIKLLANSYNVKEDDYLYKNRGTEKKVAIFEPNMSIIKWALPCAVITDSAYRQNKNLSYLYVTNINTTNTSRFDFTEFNKIMQNFDIVKDKKCSVESRYNTLNFMKQYADIAVSHQWGNPLNYLYFDLAWMGWPLVHNASLCKDVGYYYEGFDYHSAAELLSTVVNEHDKNADEYLIRNRKSIDRFLSTNKELQAEYIRLICNVLNVDFDKSEPVSEQV